MVQKQDKPATLPGVWATLSAAFELTTRYLWLMVLPAVLDLFLWIGPRLSFHTFIESVIAALPTEGVPADALALLQSAAAQMNHFTYLSVSLLGVPALMAGPMPAKTPVTPAVIDGGGGVAWLGLLLLFTVVGLLLAAFYYNLIAYAMRRTLTTALPPLGPVRFMRRVNHSWLRLIALAVVVVVLVAVVLLPALLLAGLVLLFSQTLATLVLLAALMVVIWLLMFFSFTPQGMLLNPRGFVSALADSVRLFQSSLPAAGGLLLVVVVARQLLRTVLLTADSGTWVTAILILAHAYIATALTVALFLFYRDRFVAALKKKEG